MGRPGPRRGKTVAINGARAESVDSYRTQGGITVQRVVEQLPVEGAIEPIITALDSRRGVLLASSYEYPGRYTRWDIGFVDPPLELVAHARTFRLTALN